MTANGKEPIGPRARCLVFAAAAFISALLAGCSTGASRPDTRMGLAETVPAPGREEVVGPEPFRDRSRALAHYATATALDLEADRLTQLYNYQRLSTGSRQPSLLRKARQLRGKAIEELDAALAEQPRFALILRRKGDILVEVGRTGEAMELYREAERSSPAPPRWYFGAANNLKLRGRSDEAAEILESAAAEPSGLSVEMRELALLELGQIYSAAGRLDKAEMAFRRALEEMDRAVASARTPLGKAFAEGLERDPTGVRRALVELLVRQGKFDEAIDEALAGVRRAPRDPRALGALLNAYSAGGRTAEAIEAAKRFVAQNPSDQIGVLTLIRLLDGEGSTDEAINAGREYLRANEGDAKVKSEITNLYRKAGRTQEAEQFVLGDSITAPGYPEALSLLDIYIEGGKTDKAADLAQRMMEENPLDANAATQVIGRLLNGLSEAQVEEFVDNYSAGHEGDMRARYAYARILAGKGESQRAGEIFAALAAQGAPYGRAYEAAAVHLAGQGRVYDAVVLLLKGVEDGFVSNAEALGRALVESAGEPGETAARLEGIITEYDAALTTLYEIIAGLYSNAGGNAKAEEFYRKALGDPVPRLADYVGLALSLYRQERIPEAIGLAEDLMRKGQGAPPLVRMLAAMLSQEGRFEQARRLAERLIAESPTDVDNRTSLASIFIDTVEYDSAEKELLVAQGLAEGDEEALVRVRYLLGIVYTEQHRDALALEMWRANLKIDPDDPDSNNALAYHFAERGENLSEALERIGKALAADPDNAAYLDTLGWIYYSMGDFPKAVENLSAAAAKMSDPVILDHLGDALLKSGDIEGAISAWRRALESKPKPAEKSAIEDKIRLNSPRPLENDRSTSQGENDVGS